MLRVVIAKSSGAFAAPRVGVGIDAAPRMQPAQCPVRGEDLFSTYLYKPVKKDESVLKMRIKEITDTRVHYGST